MESPSDATAGARPLDPAELVVHVQWVRRLALALVRDAHAAEDLAQETLRVTLDQPHGRVGSGAKLRAWLQRVVSRLAVDRWRAETSRTSREHSVAAPESQPATDEVVARLDQQQRVVQAVRELAEPFRSTILYRYLDQLTTREVAARMGVNEELARKRLLRGLAQLRERLDAEFGSETKTWALALLSLPGAAAVGAKAKLAVAAVIVIGAALTWRALAPGPSRSQADPVRPAGLAAPAVADGSKDPPRAAPNEVAPTRESAVDPAASAARANPSEATILHVKVVDAGQKPCTRGRLVGFWSEEAKVEDPQTRDVHVVESEIIGETTDVVLPVVTASALLSASVEGQPPSRDESIENLRSEEDPKARHGRVERDVTIEVGGGIARPRFTGRILVDGRPRVPRGFVIKELEWIDVRVHALDARYEVGPTERLMLFVTSDETVPKTFVAAASTSRPPPDERVVDLDLSSGVTLRLNVIDRESAAPLSGVELYLRIDCIAEGGHDRAPRLLQHHIVSGPDGVAVVTGLPRNGGLTIRRDATLRKRVVESRPNPAREIPLPREALLAEALDAATPAVLERTVRIDKADRALHLFGDLDATLLGPLEFGESETEVRYATQSGDLRFPWLRDLETVPHDDHGHWQFEVESGVDYRVWVEREHRRLSQVVAARAEKGDVGPVELPPRPGSDVVLRLTRCPATGLVMILVEDPGAVMQMASAVAIHGGTFERRLRLEGRTAIVVSYMADLSRQVATTQKRIEVDPATTPVVEVDLAAEGARRVTLELSTGSLQRAATLYLQRVEADGSLNRDTTAQVGFVDGEARDPIALDPGRYLYVLHDLTSAKTVFAKVLGVVDVERASDDRPISIRCELEPHAKAELGAGIDITEVAGVKLGERWHVNRSIRFAEVPELANVETVLLPVDAKFTVLEK